MITKSKLFREPQFNFNWLGVLLPGVPGTGKNGEPGDPLSQAILDPLNKLIDGKHKPAPTAPPPRDLYQEGHDALGILSRLAPEQYQLFANMLPQYGTLQSQISAASNTAQRSADVGDIANLGPDAVAAIKAANPEQRDLMTELNTQAREGLDLGTKLDAGTIHNLNQASLANTSGFGNSPQDYWHQLMTIGQAGQQRLQQRQGFAGGIANLNQQTNVDPSLAVLGRPSQAYAAGNATPGSSLNFQNPYVADINNTNFNAANSNFQQKQSIDAAMQAAIYSMIGNIVGGATGAAGAAFACHLARAVFGRRSTTWRIFRQWLLHQAPADLRTYYLVHSQKIATWIEHRPRARRETRRWMLSLLRHSLTHSFTNS